MPFKISVVFCFRSLLNPSFIKSPSELKTLHKNLSFYLDLSCQDWDSAGAGQNSSDGNFLNWAMSVIRQLLFPGKKPKEIIETGDDDEIDTDPDAGKKKVMENLKLL